MYTNLSRFGGDFRKIIDKEIASAQNVTIASGYTSLDIIQDYKNPFIEIAKKGGNSKLLLGMALYEGLSKKKLEALNELNEELLKFNNSSGVYVANGRRYHGKVYHFYNDTNSAIYVGSSNFSFSGTKGNIECTVPIISDSQKSDLERFLSELYSDNYSVRLNKAEIRTPGKKLIKAKAENLWDKIKNYNPDSIDKTPYKYFEYSLSRIVKKEKSSLNVYFGKGRLNRKTGIVTPRPWYEIELIADRQLNTDPLYPKGNFTAFTDDGYIIPMRTQGDFNKNIRSTGSLQIFGIWLKGKLERSGALNKFEPVTLDTLEEYGNDAIRFYKIEDGKYYMEF